MKEVQEEICKVFVYRPHGMHPARIWMCQMLYAHSATPSNKQIASNLFTLPRHRDAPQRRIKYRHPTPRQKPCPNLHIRGREQHLLGRRLSLALLFLLLFDFLCVTVYFAVSSLLVLLVLLVF
jgi:hypothetical protein